jgi:hypothetical protein
MNNLFNDQGNEVPPRPTWYQNSEEIVRIALDKLFSHKHYGFDEDQREDLSNLLTEHYTPYCDEYSLAKDFEWDGWSVDKDFLEQLENVCGYLLSAERDLIKKWDADFKPSPPYNIGSMIHGFDWNNNCAAQGEITGICNSSPATYIVKFPHDGDNSRTLIEFEYASVFEEVK